MTTSTPSAPTTASLPSRVHDMAQTLPMIIQGGMGVAVSSWRLARAVALTGQAFVDTLRVMRKQMGDAA